LILAGGVVSQSLGPGSASPNIVTLAGNINLQASSRFNAPDSARHLIVTAPISGGGAGVELLVTTAGSNNLVMLAGNNSFEGTVRVDNVASNGTSHQGNTGISPRTYFANASNTAPSSNGASPHIALLSSLDPPSDVSTNR
jgi:hypothetical protein